MLDEQGRCCGRKPMVYRGKNTTEAGPHRFCSRCCRAYELEAAFQMNNWAWKKVDGAWVATYPKSDYATKAVDHA